MLAAEHHHLHVLHFSVYEAIIFENCVWLVSYRVVTTMVTSRFLLNWLFYSKIPRFAEARELH